MNTALAAPQRYAGEFARVAGVLPGAKVAWLQDYRQAALARFSANGFPTTRQEDWKYTDVAALTRREFRIPEPGQQGLDSAQWEHLRFAQLDCHEMVFVNGRCVDAVSHQDKIPAGATITSIAELLAQRPDTLNAHIARCAADRSEAFTALNGAFLDDGAYIQLDPNCNVTAPIHLLFITTGDALASHPRVVIDAGANSQVKVIETYATLDQGVQFTNVLTDVTAGENAAIEHYKVQDQGLKSFHIATLLVRQDRDSRVASHSISFGAALARNDLYVDLDGPGASVTLNGLYMGKGRQHVDYHTRIHHNQPHTNSDQTYKGVLNGGARGVFNGKVVVREGAQKIAAHQSNKNLLLSKNAQVDTKPELQIYADDVICTHGATVGQLDDNALFYLRSRGIGAEAARGFLTYAFADDIIARIGIDPIRRRLEEVLLGHLPGAELIRDFVV